MKYFFILEEKKNTLNEEEEEEGTAPSSWYLAFAYYLSNMTDDLFYKWMEGSIICARKECEKA